jgi:hypothetical protein
MSLNQTQLDEIFWTHGPVVCRILRRQFPSLPEDVVDLLVVESIAKVKSNLEKQKEPVSPAHLMAMITRACQNRAIDQLRYVPRVLFVRVETLDAVSQRGEQEPCLASPAIVTELMAAILTLGPTDRKILQAAMHPPLDGDWAREFAIKELRDEGRCAGGDAVDVKELTRLCGRLRVRKHRILQKLRKAIEAKGYPMPAITKVNG